MTNSERMVQAAFNQSATDFKGAFENAMSERIGAAIDARRADVGATIGQPAESD
jgi:hypothetical protein